MKQCPPSGLEALGLARPQLRVTPDHVVAVDEPPHERRSPAPSKTELRELSNAKTRQTREAARIQEPGRCQGVVPRQNVPPREDELREIRRFSSQARDREGHDQVAWSLPSASPGDQTYKTPLETAECRELTTHGFGHLPGTKQPIERRNRVCEGSQGPGRPGLLQQGRPRRVPQYQRQVDQPDQTRIRMLEGVHGELEA